MKWFRRSSLVESLIHPLKTGLNGARIYPLDQKVALFGGAAGLSQGMMILYAILLARWLAPEAYGIYVANFVVVSFSSIVINWGLDVWILRESSTSPTPRVLVGKVILLKTLFAVPWGTALALILSRIHPDLYFLPIIVLCVFDVWLDSCLNVELAALNGHGRVRTVSLFFLISRGSRLLSGVLLILAGARDPLLFMAGRLAATFISVILAAIAFPPIFGTQAGRGLRQIFQSAIPYSASELLSLIYLQADIALIALLLGDRKTVGTYAPANSLINALFILPSVLSSYFLPILTRYFKQARADLQDPSRQMFGLHVLLGIVLFAGLALSSRFLTETLLGPEYHSTGTLLLILSPLLLFKCLNYASATYLVSVDWQKQRLAPQFVTTGLNIGLNLVAIPLWGATGAAVVYVLSEFLLAVGYMRLVIQRLSFARTASIQEES
jgi:PST family polysaccharide transporter